MAATREVSHLDKHGSVQWRIVHMPTSFIRIIIFFDGVFVYGGISKLWGYVWTNAEPLCAEF
jgi:hypothetical protein